MPAPDRRERGQVEDIILRIKYPDGSIKYVSYGGKGLDRIVFGKENEFKEFIFDPEVAPEYLTEKEKTRLGALFGKNHTLVMLDHERKMKGGCGSH